MLPEIFDVQTTIYYGFTERCQKTKFPDGELSVDCRPFPTKDSDACDGRERSFCTLWSTANYVSYLAIGFGAVACVAIIFGVSTHSRRKRIWKVVAALIGLHGKLESSNISRTGTHFIPTLNLNASGVSQLVTFVLVTDMYRLRNFPLSVIARPHLGRLRRWNELYHAIDFHKGFSWYLNLLSWVLSVATTIVIIYTGVAASRGERWAAGNRVSYGAIPR